MSKNTSIADLINYISVDGSGNVVLSTGQLVATQNYVTTAVSNLVASAPSTLDTLNELATALGNDANFATTVATSISTRVPQTRTITINGTTLDLSADRSFTVAAGISGSGTTNYIAKWTGSSALGNSNIQDSGTVITLGVLTNYTYSDNNYSGFNIRNTNTGSGALSGIAIQNSGGTIVGQINYVSTVYANATVRNTLLINTVYDNKLAFATNSGGGGTRADIYFTVNPAFSLSGSNPNQIQILGTSRNVVINYSGTDNGSNFQVNGTSTFSGTSIFGGTSTTSANPTVVMQNRVGTVLSVAGFNWAGTTTDNNSINSLMIIGGYLNTSTQTVATASSASGMQFYNGGFYWYGNSGLTPGSVYTNTQRMFLTVGGNLIIGSGGDGGYRLDVSGTSRVTGVATFSSNVGIGTTSFEGKFNVTGGSGNPVDDAPYAGYLVGKFQNSNQAYVEIRNTGGAQAGLLLKGTGLASSQHYFIGLNNDSKLRIGYGTGITNSKDGSNGVTITTGGTLSVNGTSPNSAYAFVVRLTGTTIRNAIDIFNDYEGASAAGENISCYNNVNGIVTMQVKGNGNLVNYNNSYGAISDVNLKENILDATPKLDDILRLKVRNFNFKTNKEEKQIGFIAQELEEVFPSLIEEAKNPKTEETFKTIKTSVLVPMLVKAIQELNQKGQEQQAQIETLTQKVNALENI
jgi:hypothetical protein